MFALDEGRECVEALLVRFFVVREGFHASQPFEDVGEPIRSQREDGVGAADGGDDAEVCDCEGVASDEAVLGALEHALDQGEPLQEGVGFVLGDGLGPLAEDGALKRPTQRVQWRKIKTKFFLTNSLYFTVKTNATSSVQWFGCMFVCLHV